MTTATAPGAPVEVETLPDGRELRVMPDGSILVLGAAQARPHPVPGVDWIARTPPRRRAPVARTSRPARSGVARTRHPATAGPAAREAERRAAHGRANELLVSLLDAQQRSDWARTGTFWVEVPQGRLRFGRLYAIRFEPNDSLLARTLCVVPARHEELPGPDIWANLLLAVRDDPDRFFAVAVDRTTERGRRRA